VVPLQLFVASLIGWFQSGQHEIIEYLREENRTLKAQLHRKRVRLTDDERRRLAVLVHVSVVGSWRRLRRL
jgi:hypothetical protein